MNKASEIDISKIDTNSVEFQNALRLISYTSQSVFLTGKAGTGKSTFLQYLTHTTKKKFVVLAPTGIAAVNAGGQTMHSFFKLPFKPILPDDPEFATHSRLRDRMKYSKQMVKMLKSLDLIIIDEVSMVRADTIDFIDRLLRVYCGNPRQPFAGKQLLLVGDVFQLEPVITADTHDILARYYKDGFFFFNARAFQDLQIVPIELSKVYRQNDNNFIQMLDRVRIGAPSQQDLMLLNSRVEELVDAKASQFTMTIATRRDIVDSINKTMLDSLKTPLRTFTGIVTGDFPENSLPTDRELTLREGAQVVFVKNDIERRWVNGTVGKIVEICNSTITVQLESGEKHSVEQSVWENVKYEYDEEKHKIIENVIGTYTQYPIKLAWALTIHKSQGLTFDKVIIDVGHGAFSGGQTYVALSRCRSFEGIKLRSTINQRDIFVNQRVVRFSRTFNNDLLINSALENAKADDYYNRAAKAFNTGNYATAVDYFSQAVTARADDLRRPEVARLLRQKFNIIIDLNKRVEELEQKLAEDKKKFQKLASEYIELGEACREEGWEMQAAISNYDKALSIDPDNDLALICKGKALGEMGMLDDAIDCLLKASKLNATDYRSLLEAGRLLINNGDVAQGMEYLLHAEQRNKKVADVHLAIADAYEKVDDLENAKKHRDIAAKLKKKNK